MNTKTELRVDVKNAAAISTAMNLLTEYGYDRALSHLKAEGIDDSLSKYLLSLRYDRRSGNRAGLARSVGIFRANPTDV